MLLNIPVVQHVCCVKKQIKFVKVLIDWILWVVVSKYDLFNPVL